MKRFKNILFYTDGNAASVPALARAVDLAQRNQGRLTVASVLEELPRDLSRLAAALPSGDTVVPKLAAEAQIDLIVMGTVARAGLAGYFIGNTAETVVQHATCSVLTVKPEGFVSPVTLA